MDSHEERDRILLFDDSLENAQALGRILWTGGYDVAFATSREQLWKRLRILSFDLILANASLVPADNPLFWLEIRERSMTREIPVLVLMNSGQISLADVWLESGLSDFMEYPLKAPEDLLAKIKVHIQICKRITGLETRILELEKSNQDKDRFYSILSHDLKAPFQGLVGLLEILHGEYETLSQEEIREYIRNIHNATKGTFRLLENLLEWSGLQAGQLRWNPKDLNLKILLEDVMGLFSIGARDKGITMSCEVDPLFHVFADPRMVASVVRNLIYNGIKYTREGGEIFVKVRESVDYYEISVNDTGVGMDPKSLETLLKDEDFHTTPGTAKESGSGLGIKLCRQFVERNGGQFWVHSTPGQGSSFRFSLPRRKIGFSTPLSF